MTTANRNQHPTLLSENEMKRRSATINPTILQRNPVQSDHYFDIQAKRRRTQYGKVGQDVPK